MGRQKSIAIAVLLVIGVALPPIGALLRPFVNEAVIALLTIAFMRLEGETFRAQIRRPGIVLAASAWTSLAIPSLFAVACLISGLDAKNPDLFLGLMLQGITSPMMAAPAIAAILGLDATLVIAVLVVSSAMTPFSAPLVAYAIGLDLPFSPLSLGLKLFAILAGSALAGLVLRRLIGVAKISKFRDEIDGLNIIFLFVFVAAIMGDVGIRFLAQPMFVLGLTGLAFAVFALVMALTTAVFAKSGMQRALALGLVTSQRNLGLMIAATGGVLPDATWLYFAVGQFPLYLSPLLAEPIARKLAR